METKFKLKVTKRVADIHICIDGKPAIWGAGKTLYEALGDFISSHREKFGIEIEFDEKSFKN